ncbi:MAG: hypothetical protein LBI60_00545 [Bacteroidales bacterium]|jgi:hypothetical protein|nr:hypothetical protein [Bacteroidales bacterium]
MKTISRFLGIFIVTMLIGTLAYGQKCKYDIDKKDPFTGQTTKSIQVRHHNAFNVFEYWELNFNKVDNDYNITLTIIVMDFKPVVKGDPVMISIVNPKTSSDGIMTLYAENDVVPTRHLVGSSAAASEVGQYITKYPVTKEELELLANGTPGVIRITLTTTYDREISSDEAKKIQKAINCLLQ